jgi:hypothetical protein
LDLKRAEEEKVKSEKEAKPIVTANTIIETKIEAVKRTEEKTKVERTKTEPINFVFKKAEEKKVQVRIAELRKLPEISLPVLTKENGKYNIESSNDMCKKLFLKKDDDDPMIREIDNYETIPERSPTEEEIMEEDVCHGNGMWQVKDTIDDEMLPGEGALKSKMQKERKEDKAKQDNFNKNREPIEEFFKNNIQEMLENKKKLHNAKEDYVRRKLDHLCRKELNYEMNPFTWIIIKDKNGSTKIEVVDENDDHKEWEKTKTLKKEDILRMVNYEEIPLEIDETSNEKEAIIESCTKTFKEKKEIMNEFFDKNWKNVVTGMKNIRWVESQNGEIIEYMKKKGLSMELYTWKFFRSINNLVKVAIYAGNEKIDPELEKKKKLYWGKANNVIFRRRNMLSDVLREKQKRIDKLNIKKGFPQIIWEYCTFTLEEYERRKAKLKIKRGFAELFVPKLHMEEEKRKFDKLFGAYSMQGDLPYADDYEFTRGIREHGKNSSREAIHDNGDVFKHEEGEHGE